MKLSRFQPTIIHLEEPKIVVGDGIEVPEPKIGWTLTGPMGSATEHSIHLGIIGDAESLEKTKELLARLTVQAFGKNRSFLHLDFPGLPKMRLKLIVQWAEEITDNELSMIENSSSFSECTRHAAQVVEGKIKAIMDKEPRPDVLLLAYPKKIDYYCIERAIGHRRAPRKTPLEQLIQRRQAQNKTLDKYLGTQAPTPTYQPVDLRSLVKSICMTHDIPIQILRPSTTEPYDPDRPHREDDATTFWNLVVALFYKANNIPWRVKGIMQDTCYLGVSFFRDRGDPSTVKTALAQVFALDGEGFVLKGKHAVTDQNRAPHVTKEEAMRLVQAAIDVYRRNNADQTPRRVVVHKTSRYSDDELVGFRLGAENIPVDLLALGTRDIKLIRWGKEPPIRGTMVRMPDNSTLLYTFGYIPYLDVYPGPRVPSPLEILEHHGSTSREDICREILALTKLNWNSAKFCAKAPVTIAFARRVGGILRECPPNITPRDKFRFYM